MIRNAVSRAIRQYETLHPRLRPSVLPLSQNVEANTIPYITAEFMAQATAMGLRGRAKTRYVEEKVAEARASITGVPQKEK